MQRYARDLERTTDSARGFFVHDKIVDILQRADSVEQSLIELTVIQQKQRSLGSLHHFAFYPAGFGVRIGNIDFGKSTGTDDRLIGLEAFEKSGRLMAVNAIFGIPVVAGARNQPNAGDGAKSLENGGALIAAGCRARLSYSSLTRPA